MRSARFQGGGFRSLRKYQGGWVQIIYWLVALIITIVLAPKPATPRAAAIEDFDLPVAEADRPIPVLFGRKRITGANVLWYGDLSTSKIKKRSLFSSTTVGYKYYLAMHMGFCLGPIDAFHAIDIGDKRAWTGNQTSNGFGGIDQPDLFGGEKREGGISGTIHFRFGAPDQEADEYLSLKISEPMPAFRGISCIIFNSYLFGFGRGGGYVGTTPYVKPWAVTCSRILKGWHNDDVWYPTRANVNGGMNAAHIIYQCLTDPEWGMGAPVSLIDDANFRALADTCFNEGLGLNLLWNQTTTIEDFIQIVLDHIAGGLGFDPASGKYIVTLIRGDYVPATLPLFNNSNMVEVQDFQRRAWAETVNELAITYTDATTGKSVPIVVQDLGNIRAQQARIPDKIDRTGITSLDVIRVVAGRELASRSTPLARIDFTCDRKAWNVAPYGVIRITRSEPEMHLDETVFRVVDIKKGNLERGTITVSAIEDIYALAGIEYGEEQPTTPDADPILPPDDGPDNSGTVSSTTTTSPPNLTSLSDGQRFLVPLGATGEWAGHGGQIAEWDADEETWVYIDVPDGVTIYDDESGETVQVYGGETQPFGGGAQIIVVDEDADPDEIIDPVEMLVFKGAQVDDLGTGGARIVVSPLTTKGDIYVRGATGNLRQPAGADGTTLIYDSAQATGLRAIRPQVGMPASAARVNRDTAQAINPTTWTLIEWTDEAFDSEAYWTPTIPERFTVPRDGKYVLQACVAWDLGTDGGDRALAIRLNGSDYVAAAENDAASSLSQSVMTVLDLVEGDYIEFLVHTTAGSPVDLMIDKGQPHATISRVGNVTSPAQIRGATWVRAGAQIAVPVNDVYVRCPRNGVIRSVSIATTGGVGSCTVDIWRDTHANFPPTAIDSICGPSKPFVSAGRASQDTTLTGWDTTVNAGDWLAFHLESTSIFTGIFVQLEIEETE